MECRDIRRILSALADGEASPEQLRAAEGHLEACAECRRAHERIRRLGGAMARAEGEVPAGFREALFARMEREELLPARRSIFAYSLRWAAIPAAVAAGALVFVVASREPAPTPGRPKPDDVRVAQRSPVAAVEPVVGEARSKEAAQPVAAPPDAARDLSPEEREIVANLELLEGAAEFEANGGADDIDILLPSTTDKG